MSDICPECHSTIQPDYSGACVTCLRREHARIRADLADAKVHLANSRANCEALERIRDSLTASIVAACEGTGCLNAHELRQALDTANIDLDRHRRYVGCQMAMSDFRTADEMREALNTASRERDEARRDRDTLAAEVWAWREHHADRPGMEVMAAMRDGCRTYEVLRKARAATDATGALNRAGGGA